MSREARPPVGKLPAEGGTVRSGWHLLHLGRQDAEVKPGLPGQARPWHQSLSLLTGSLLQVIGRSQPQCLICHSARIVPAYASKVS